MEMNIVLPDNALRYVLYQRTDYLLLPHTFPYRVFRKLSPRSAYHRIVGLESVLRRKQIKATFNKDIRREFAMIETVLPAECRRVLDVGCGVGGIDVLLHRHYAACDPKFYLLDKTSVEDTVFYGFERAGADYNSLEVTAEVLTANGIPRENLFLLQARDDWRIDINESLDFVISLISWGFHYPVDTYLDRVHELLDEGGSLILDVRVHTDGESKIRKRFRDVQVIIETEKYRRLFAVK